MLGELDVLRNFRNFHRVTLPASSAFHLRLRMGRHFPVFSIYVNNVAGNAFLTGLVLSVTSMAGVSSAGQRM